MSVAKEARKWDTLRSGTWDPSADLPVWDACHPSLDRPAGRPPRHRPPPAILGRIRPATGTPMRVLW